MADFSPLDLDCIEDTIISSRSLLPRSSNTDNKSLLGSDCALLLGAKLPESPNLTVSKIALIMYKKMDIQHRFETLYTGFPEEVEVVACDIVPSILSQY